jgi:LmbE family N-acetylglucosaminyl deacetylase
MKKILAIAPHTDDIELGCGATLHKHRNEYQIDVLAITAAQPLAIGDPVQEFYNAMNIINANVTFLDWKPRILNESTTRIIRLFLETYNKKIIMILYFALHHMIIIKITKLFMKRHLEHLNIQQY